MRSQRTTRSSFKRSGLHRLECECGSYVYDTVAQLEQRGMPVCGCGGAFVPDRLELAMLLGIEDCPAVDEYRREIERVGYGQQRQTGAGHSQRMMGRVIDDPTVKAAARVEQRRRESARERRISAILPVPEPMAF